jgi:hypothetical protein
MLRALFPNLIPASSLNSLYLLLDHVPTSFFLLFANLYFFFTGFHFGLTFLPLFLYLVSSLSSPISTFMPLFYFLSLFGPLSHVLALSYFAAYSFLFFSPVSSSRSTTRSTSMMSVPHQQDRANRTAALLETGGVSRAMARPFIGCHSHIHAACNVVRSSIIVKRD